MESKIVIRGKTHKGKNRVREHGEVWKIKEDAYFQAQEAFLLISLSGKDMRWVLKVNDPDFEIIG